MQLFKRFDEWLAAYDSQEKSHLIPSHSKHNIHTEISGHKNFSDQLDTMKFTLCIMKTLLALYLMVDIAHATTNVSGLQYIYTTIPVHRVVQRYKQLFKCAEMSILMLSHISIIPLHCQRFPNNA